MRTPYYQSGDITLYHGDCEEVLAEMPRGVAQFVTSPPYNLSENPAGNWRKRRKRGRWHNYALQEGYEGHGDALPYAEYVSWQRRVLTRMWEALDDDGAIFYNHKPRVFQGQVRLPLELNPGLPLRQVIIWTRDGGINANSGYFLPAHEWVLLLAKPSFRLRHKTAGSATDVWHFPCERNNPHPAPFPAALPCTILEATKPGLVCDPFCGSGTTLLACKMYGRPGVGIEMSERYCEMAANNLERLKAVPLRLPFEDEPAPAQYALGLSPREAEEPAFFVPEVLTS